MGKRTKAAKKVRARKSALKPKAKKLSRRNAPKTEAKKFSAKTEFTEEKVQDLIRRGKLRGFITYSEILNKFQHIERNIVFLEDLYNRLQEVVVDVVEGKDILG